MRRPGRSWALSALPWILLSLVLLAWSPGFFYDRFSHEVTTGLDKLWAISFLAFPIVGVFLTRRIPTNPVGWLFLVGPALIGAGVSIIEYGEAVGQDLVTLSGVVFDMGLVAMFSSILLFPDGRYPSRWFRWAHLIGLAGFVVSPVLADDASSGAIAFNFVLSILSLIRRWVRGDAIVRRQVAGPVLVAFLGLVLTALLAVKGLLVTSENERLDILIGTAASMTVSIGIPVSIAVAITRYRLYDIDRIISRTVSYAVVVGLLGLLAAALVAGMAVFLSSDDPLVVAVATLTVAGLFNPLRRRVQRVVDRRFNRSRYDAERVIGRFSGSLQEQVDPDEVVEDWISTVTQTVEPAEIAVWIRE